MGFATLWTIFSQLHLVILTKKIPGSLPTPGSGHRIPLGNKKTWV
jgi:hypothetical protein